MKYATSTMRPGIRNAVLLGLAMWPIADASSAFAEQCVSSTSMMVGSSALCQRCTYKALYSTSKDTICSHSYVQYYQAGVETVMVGASIAKHPRNGRLKIEGMTWTYTPNKGFVGEDVFTIERDFLQNTKTVHVVYFENTMKVGQ